MAIERRIETRSEMFMGEVLTYNVDVWVETVPAPSVAESPYAKDGNSTTARRVDEPLPARPEKRRPSKAEYLRAFAADGALPRCVVVTCTQTARNLDIIARHFATAATPMPRRMARALRMFAWDDLASFYDGATLARIAWHFMTHVERWGRFRPDGLRTDAQASAA